MRGYSADRISNLPHDVINRILEHLPLRDAVRTSLLSRGWRYKWVTIPCLAFDREFMKQLKYNYDLQSIIDRILVLHRGDIVKFSLVNCPIKDRPAINRWLLFLSDRHHIEDLELSYANLESDNLYPMPTQLFAFNHLTHLNIGCCKVKLPPEFGGFSRLCRLDLVDVDIECADLEMWLSKCPMLEYFYMSDFRGCLSMDIDAPNLKFFYFLGGLESISFKNTKLEEISLGCDGFKLYPAGLLPEEYFELPESRGSESDLYKVLGHIQSLKKLDLDSSFLPYLAGRGLPCKIPSNFDRLTLLQFSPFDFGSIIDVACALCFIRSSPNLQSLKLSSCNQGVKVDAITQYLKEQQQKCDFLHSRLKYVQIHGMSNAEHETELAKLLLQWATALEELEIQSIYCKKTDKQDGYKMLKEIASFRRSSSQAVVIFD